MIDEETKKFIKMLAKAKKDIDDGEYLTEKEFFDNHSPYDGKDVTYSPSETRSSADIPLSEEEVTFKCGCKGIPTNKIKKAMDRLIEYYCQCGHHSDGSPWECGYCIKFKEIFGEFK